MIDFIGNTAIALGFTALGVCALAQPAKAMDDATIAAIYTTDVILCGFEKNQDAINTAIVNVIFNEDLSPSQARLKAAQISVVLQEQVRESGQVVEYCRKRMGR